MKAWLRKIACVLSMLTFVAPLELLAKRPCVDELGKLGAMGPTTLPEAPPAPARPAPVRPEPQPDPTPKRREVPIPAPDEPGRQIPAKPLEDPKDIQPEDLYSTDAKVGSFWNEMPIGLRKIMIEEMRKERAKLEGHMQEKYGGSDVQTLTRAMKVLQTEIEVLETSHKAEVLAVIRSMMEKRYGDTIDGLSIQITRTLPKPQQTQAAQLPSAPKGLSSLVPKFLRRGDQPQDGITVMIPELPRSLDEGMIFRTELRNLWLQGEGWVGMKEFAFGYSAELNAIAPGLAEKYQELDRLYRFGQLAQLDLVDLPTEVDEVSRDAISAGREIVTTDFEIVEGADGSKSVRVKELKGIAVGRNGWAAAHEARKAGSQMVTSAEGAYRWMMPSERRQKLDDATNSSRAEIRQGVFGPAVVVAMRRRLELLPSGKMTEEKNYQVIEGLFSLPPGVFIHATKLLFDSQFETSKTLQGELYDLLKDHGVLG